MNLEQFPEFADLKKQYTETINSLRGEIILLQEELQLSQEKVQKLDDITMGEGDRLGEIFIMQKELMKRLNVPFPENTLQKISLYQLYQYTGDLCTCISQESAELRDWTPWKHWSKKLGNKSDIEHGSAQHLKEMQLEIIDLIHFTLELAIVHGMTAQDIYDIYVEKNNINHERQDRGTY